MVEAAMRGLIDFREADPRDRRWWFRLRLALDHLERTNVVAQHRLYYDYSLAILSRDDLTEQSSRQFTRDAETQLFAMINLWRPWDRHDPRQSQQAQLEALHQAWAKEFGNPNDPATQKAIAETVRMLQKMDRSRKTHAPAVPG